jgi:hypothetical protein
MTLRRIVAPMIVCTAALACGLLPASASAAGTPTLVGSVSSNTDLSGATSVAVSGHYAYSTAYWAGELTAVDISNPTHPVIAGHSASSSTLENADTVAIAGGYAYVVSKNRNASTSSNDDGTGNALTILDIHTNPATPTIVGSVHDSAHLFGAYGIAIQGSFAYVAYQGLLSGQPNTPDTSTGGFSVINISNPASPTITANIDNGSLTGAQTNDLWHADAVSISGGYAFVTAQYAHALTVINISNPAAPAIAGKVSDSTNLQFANDVAIQGNYAYVADQVGVNGVGRFTIVDISNPPSPKIAGSVTSAALNQAYRVRVRGNLAFVSALHADTISIINVANPANPTVAATVQDHAHLHRTSGVDIALTGRYLIASSPILTGTGPTFPPYPLQGGPSVTGTVSVVDLDPSPVSVSITSPGNGAQYKQGQVVHAAYSCAPGGLVAVASCTGPVTNGAPINTATPGKHTFTVTGTDQDGQTGAATVTYVVGGPMITGLRQSHRRWREHGRKKGTTFTITLNQSAKLTLMFTQTARGRMVGGRCVARTKHNRHHHACTRTLVLGKLKINGHTGTNKVTFSGRAGRVRLRPGRYTLVVTATAGGITSARRTISFTILP